MDASELLGRIREGMTATTVYGEPIERDGVIVIPASSVMGGGGGGGGVTPGAPGEATEAAPGPIGEGSGVGFGVTARPAGAFVIHGEEVEWVPAIDRNRQILFSSIMGILAILTVRAVLLRLLRR